MVWQVLWSALTAISTLALAVATFLIILRDRKVALQEKKPNILISDSEAKEEGAFGEGIGEYTQTTFKFTINNLSKFPIVVRRVTITHEGGDAVEIPVAVLVPPNSSRDTCVSKPHTYEDYQKLHITIYFQYGGTGGVYHKASMAAQVYAYHGRHFRFDEVNQILQTDISPPEAIA